MSAQCYKCHTTATPLWRKDDEGKIVFNAYVFLSLVRTYIQLFLQQIEGRGARDQVHFVDKNAIFVSQVEDIHVVYHVANVPFFDRATLESYVCCRWKGLGALDLEVVRLGSSDPMC